MLHYIVFVYVCDVALEVFRALWDRAAVGNVVRWRTGTKPRWGMEDKDTVGGIPFRSNSNPLYIPFYFDAGAGEFGRRAASRHISRVGRPGARITDNNNNVYIHKHAADADG